VYYLEVVIKFLATELVATAPIKDLSKFTYF